MTGPLLPPRIARALSFPPPRFAVPPPRARRQFAEGRKHRGGGEASVGSTWPEAVGGEVDDGEDPLALPFLIRSWLGGTGALVAPGTAAFEVAAKQAAAAKQRAEASASEEQGERQDSAAAAGAGTSADGPSLPDDNGVIYVNLGRMPQLDKWQLVTVLQALSSPSEAVCWGGGGGAEDRLGRYRVLWVLPREQREQLLLALLPMAPPPSFRLKVLGGLPHLGVSAS